MSIQSSINQTLGATAIATKLYPELQEIGERIRTERNLHKTEGQIEKILSKGQPTWSTESGEPTGKILDENQIDTYDLLKKQQREQYYKALGLGANVDFKDFGPAPIGWEEAQQAEAMGLIQRNKVEAMKSAKQELRDWTFGGKYYGNDKQ